MRSVLFTPDCFDDYNYWQEKDKKVFKKLKKLIKECQREPENGTGKPEKLKGNFQGYWSRRITQEHRLVYKYTDKVLEIIACRYHYE